MLMPNGQTLTSCGRDVFNTCPNAGLMLKLDIGWLWSPYFDPIQSVARSSVEDCETKCANAAAVESIDTRSSGTGPPEYIVVGTLFFLLVLESGGVQSPNYLLGSSKSSQSSGACMRDPH